MPPAVNHTEPLWFSLRRHGVSTWATLKNENKIAPSQKDNIARHSWTFVESKKKESSSFLKKRTKKLLFI
jgi:hypothetical protein